MQQDSKQIQVDLQDLGYETCGRSENEAEREDTSSPGVYYYHHIKDSVVLCFEFYISNVIQF